MLQKVRRIFRKMPGLRDRLDRIFRYLTFKMKFRAKIKASRLIAVCAPVLYLRYTTLISSIQHSHDDDDITSTYDDDDQSHLVMYWVFYAFRSLRLS